MYLTQALHQSLQQDPDRPFTVFGERRRSVAEAVDRVSRFAGALRQLGLAEGDRVAPLGLNSDRYLEYQLAIPWAGGVVNPVNIRWSPAEIAYSLTDCETRILLLDDAFSPMVGALRELAPGLTTVVHCGNGVPPPEGALSYEALLASAEPVPDRRRGGDELYGVFYTVAPPATPRGSCSATATSCPRR